MTALTLRAQQRLIVDGGHASGVAIDVGGQFKVFDTTFEVLTSGRFAGDDARIYGVPFIARTVLAPGTGIMGTAALTGSVSALLDVGTRDVIIHDAFAWTETAWSGGSGTSLVLDIGVSGTPDLFVNGSDNFVSTGYHYTAASQKGTGLTDDRTAVVAYDAVALTVTSVGDNLDQYTAGRTHVLIRATKLWDLTTK